jgi:hypothetical protein
MTTADLTPAELDAYEERAAIFQFETGMTKEAAEEAALKAVLATRPPAQATRQGIEALAYLTAHGLPIKDFYKPGADADKANYSTAEPIEPGRRYKVFIRGRFLCLDIDRNHKDGKDGIAELYAHLETIGEPRELLPACLKDIDRGSFPFFTETPSGGLHLWFKYAGPYVTGTLAPDVELKNLQVSAGWKEHNGKPAPYILHGDIEAAPVLPAFILAKITPPKAASAPPYRPPWQEKKEYGRASWALIVTWTDQDGRGGAGRNNRAYSLALHAKSHDWPQADTLAALQNEPSIEGLPFREIQTAVKSAYRE